MNVYKISPLISIIHYTYYDVSFDRKLTYTRLLVTIIGYIIVLVRKMYQFSLWISLLKENIEEKKTSKKDLIERHLILPRSSIRRFTYKMNIVWLCEQLVIYSTKFWILFVTACYVRWSFKVKSSSLSKQIKTDYDN